MTDLDLRWILWLELHLHLFKAVLLFLCLYIVILTCVFTWSDVCTALYYTVISFLLAVDFEHTWAHGTCIWIYIHNQYIMTLWHFMGQINLFQIITFTLWLTSMGNGKSMNVDALVTFSCYISYWKKVCSFQPQYVSSPCSSLSWQMVGKAVEKYKFPRVWLRTALQQSRVV